MTASHIITTTAPWLVAALWSLHATAVQGQEVYRCGGETAVRYQAVPCADGQRIDATDARSEAQRQEARARVQRESRLADSLNQAQSQRLNAVANATNATVIGRRATLDDAKDRPPKRRAGAGISRGKQQKAPTATDLAVPLNGAKALPPPAAKSTTDRGR